MNNGRFGGIFLVLVIMLAGVGASYAVWTDTITIDGTINTGNVALTVVDVSETYVYKNLLTHETIISDVPLDDDEFYYIASATASISGDNEVTIVWDNIFPSIDFIADVVFLYDGSIPVKIQEINYEITSGEEWLTPLFTTGKFWVDMYRTNADGTMQGEAAPIGTQLHQGDYVKVDVHLELPQDNDLQGMNGRVVITITVVQWNEFTPPPVNNPPHTPSNPNPENGETGVDVTNDLSWTGGDPDPSDMVTYDVYFGTSNNPPKVVSNQTATTYDPTLYYETTYYWKIVAWDNHGAHAESPIWGFTTMPMRTHLLIGVIPSHNEVTVGEEFTITIYIDPVQEVGGWEIYQFNFAQGLVNATGVTPGSYWESFFDNGTINNDTGTITGIQTWSTGPYPDNNYTACTIRFTALQPGICTFEIADVEIADSLGYIIMDVTIYDATVVITP